MLTARLRKAVDYEFYTVSLWKFTLRVGRPEAEAKRGRVEDITIVALHPDLNPQIRMKDIEYNPASPLAWVTMVLPISLVLTARQQDIIFLFCRLAMLFTIFTHSICFLGT